MEVEFALLADAANISREGKLNILGAFDRIHGSQFPLTWPRMVLVTRFIASAAEYGQEKQLEIITLDADGKRLGRAQGRIRIGSGQSGRQVKMNHVLPMAMKFPAPGQYSVEVLINSEPKATVPLEVVERKDKPDTPPDGEQQADV